MSDKALTDEAALRTAILSQPGEDTPRLMYVDLRERRNA